MAAGRDIVMVCLLASCMILASPGSGLADDAEALKGRTLMDEVVVTGSRIEEKITQVPANITVITEEDIRASNAKNIPEILRYQEGVVVKDLLGTGRTAQVALRGFADETGSANTLILVDGRRVNPIDMSHINWNQIPIDQVARIEILRGTGTVLYGDNAVGGVINIITKVPEEGFSGRTSFTAGSFGRHKEQASFSGGRGGLAASGNFSYDSTDGYRENNHFRARDASGRLSYDPTDLLKLHVHFGYHSDVYGMPGALNENDYVTNRRSASNPDDNAKSDDSFISAGFESLAGDYGKLMAELSYRRMSTKSDFPDTIFPFLTENDIDTLGFTPRFVFDRPVFDRANTFIIGSDIYRSDLTLNSYLGVFSPIPTPSGRDTVERKSIGFYATNETEIFEKIFFSVGARTEKVKDELEKLDLPANIVSLKETVKSRENAFSTGLSYLYAEDSALFFKANRSFRYPLTDELTELDLITFTTVINSDMKPQTGRHYDIGVRHSFHRRFQGSLTLFRAEIKNEIFFDPIAFSNENHPETLRRGLETGLRFLVLDNIALNANYTYQKATFEEDPFRGRFVPAVPRHKTSFGVRFSDLPLPGLSLSTDYTVVGSSYLISDQANQLDKLDRYSLLDAKISYRKNFVEVFVGVDNLLDKKYAQYAVAGGGGTTRNFYPAPERTWTAGVEMRF